MRIFDETKTKELNENDIDFIKYKLESSKLFVRHHEAVAEVQKQSHYETIMEYENGGKDVVEVIDVPYVAPKDAYDEYEDILIVVPLSDKEILDNLRNLRIIECFSILNQNYVIEGKSYTWFDTLSDIQKLEAKEWIQQWRDVTETKVIPKKPKWLN